MHFRTMVPNSGCHFHILHNNCTSEVKVSWKSFPGFDNFFLNLLRLQSVNPNSQILKFSHLFVSDLGESIKIAPFYISGVFDDLQHQIMTNKEIHGTLIEGRKSPTWKRENVTKDDGRTANFQKFKQNARTVSGFWLENFSV